MITLLVEPPWAGFFPYLALLTFSISLLAPGSCYQSAYPPAEAVKMRNRRASHSKSGLCTPLSPPTFTSYSGCGCCLPNPADDSNQMNWRRLWETANQLDTDNGYGSSYQQGSQLPPSTSSQKSCVATKALQTCTASASMGH